eukprot:GFKZ01012207.1.p2 GENE.GFKZ01012207.1~~GFKZ01012207.1.p2  ORF type:complete len:108 (+),score=1.91 GFKZ01012207.1:246-569(+)
MSGFGTRSQRSSPQKNEAAESPQARYEILCVLSDLRGETCGCLVLRGTSIVICVAVLQAAEELPEACICLSNMKRARGCRTSLIGRSWDSAAMTQAAYEAMLSGARG